MSCRGSSRWGREPCPRSCRTCRAVPVAVPSPYRRCPSLSHRFIVAVPSPCRCRAVPGGGGAPPAPLVLQQPDFPEMMPDAAANQRRDRPPAAALIGGVAAEPGRRGIPAAALYPRARPAGGRGGSAAVGHGRLIISSRLISSRLCSSHFVAAHLSTAQHNTAQHRISRRGGSRRSPPPALAACVPTGTLLGSVRSGSVRFGFPSRGTANLGYAEELLGCLRCLCALHAAAFGGHRASSGGCDPVPTAQTGRDGTGRDATSSAL